MFLVIGVMVLILVAGFLVLIFINGVNISLGVKLNSTCMNESYSYPMYLSAAPAVKG